MTETNVHVLEQAEYVVVPSAFLLTQTNRKLSLLTLLCTIMDSSFWFHVINLDGSLNMLRGSLVIFAPKICISFSEDQFCLSKQCRP